MPFGRFLKTVGAGILLVIGGYIYVHKPVMPQSHFDTASLEQNVDPEDASTEGEHVPADFLSDIASTTATSSVSVVSSTSSKSNPQ